jgi:hypothetical protein
VCRKTYVYPGRSTASQVVCILVNNRINREYR